MPRHCRISGAEATISPITDFRRRRYRDARPRNAARGAKRTTIRSVSHHFQRVGADTS